MPSTHTNQTIRLRPLAAAVLLTLTLAACGGGGGGSSEPEAPTTPPVQTEPTAAENIAALEASGAIPKLDRSAQVKGTDANSNGVRDDIDTYIAAKYSQQAQRAALTQFAAALQSSLLANKADASAVKALSVRGSRAINCIYTRFDGKNGTAHPSAAAQEVISITTNTKERLIAHLAFSKALDGAVLTLPEGNTCE